MHLFSLLIPFLTIILFPSYLHSMYPYNKKNITADNSSMLGCDRLKDPYVVDGEYTHDFKTMYFSNCILCELKAKIPSPDGIKHIILPFGKINQTLRNLEKLNDQEFQNLSDYVLGITERDLKEKHSKNPPEIWVKLKEIESNIKLNLFRKDIDNINDIMRYILYSLQGDRTQSPYKSISNAPTQNDDWDSRLPKYIYDEHRERLRKEKEEIQRSLEAQLIQRFNSSFSIPENIDNCLIKKLNDLKNESKEALQVLFRFCHFCDNENINWFIQNNETIQKYLPHYLRYKIIEKTGIKTQQGISYIYAISEQVRNTILGLTVYSIKQLSKKDKRTKNLSIRTVEYNDQSIPTNTKLTPRSQRIQEQLLQEMNKTNRKSKGRSNKIHKRNYKNLKDSSSSSSSSPQVRRTTPKAKRKPNIPRLEVPASPRQRRSNSINDPMGSARNRDKITTRERRCRTDGDGETKEILKTILLKTILRTDED